VAVTLSVIFHTFRWYDHFCPERSSFTIMSLVHLNKLAGCPVPRSSSSKSIFQVWPLSLGWTWSLQGRLSGFVAWGSSNLQCQTVRTGTFNLMHSTWDSSSVLQW
jgi:hypothetical protein